MDQYSSDYCEHRPYNKYKNGKIYKLINGVDDEIYVGSTIMTIGSRFSHHKSSVSIYPDRPVYKHIRDIGVEYFTCVLVEKYPCENYRELQKREEYWKIKLSASLNGQKCYQTTEQLAAYKRQWEKENKVALTGKRRARNAKYYNDVRKKKYAENKDEINAKRREIAATEEFKAKAKVYNENRKDKSAKWQRENKDRRNAQKRERRKQNPEKTAKEYAKHNEYMKTNKEVLKAKRAEKFDCTCGGTYSHGNKANHMKTKRHLEGKGAKKIMTPEEKKAYNKAYYEKKKAEKLLKSNI